MGSEMCIRDSGRRRALVARSRPRVGCCRDGSGGSTGSSERALDASNVANSTLAIFCRASTGGGLRLRWTYVEAGRVGIVTVGARADRERGGREQQDRQYEGRHAERHRRTRGSAIGRRSSARVPHGRPRPSTVPWTAACVARARCRWPNLGGNFFSPDFNLSRSTLQAGLKDVAHAVRAPPRARPGTHHWAKPHTAAPHTHAHLWLCGTHFFPAFVLRRAMSTLEFWSEAVRLGPNERVRGATNARKMQKWRFHGRCTAPSAAAARRRC